MAAGVDDLTDKEKEALRLLLAGHDAKSSAAELGISPHTLTDRLRHARRKLGVTSSREAARILGDAEGVIPQTHVHTPMGVEDDKLPSDDEDIASETGRDTSRPVWRRRGVLIMSIAAAIAAATLALTSSNFGTTGPGEVAEERQPDPFSPSTPVGQSDAERAAHAWLTLIDSGFAERSLAAAAPALRSRYSDDAWELGVLLRLNNYGEPLRRQLLSADITSQASDGALGDFETLVFETDFASENGVREKVILKRVEGSWKVFDYDIIEPESC